MRVRKLLAVAVCLTLACLAPHATASPCASLRDFHASGATIDLADPVTSGTVTTPLDETVSSLPSFCRVAGVLRPTSDSEIHFEVWLPNSGWNGRFLVVGNGGFAGTINYGQMADGLRLGFATASTDAGHQAGAEDASWAYHHPEKVADYGYRALHLTTQIAKQIIATTYGRAPEHAYFDACSNGGREGLIEAQRFPEDFDGILDGAPANNWTAMLSSGIDVSQTLNGNPAAYISALKLPAIHRKVLDECDALDGVKDGIVSDPSRCHFDPATLLCPAGADSLECLTAPQVAALRKLYAGGSSHTGESIFPGYALGSELPGWTYWVIGPGPGASAGARYPVNFFRYMVTEDPTWDPFKADAASIKRQADAKTGKDLNATNPDLRPFVARGGKLILYHGWYDSAISPWNAIHYWNDVRRTLGDATTDSAVRLYMVPGMEHCSGGPGPTSFGQLGLPAGAGPGSGMLDLLQAWVETGKAPGPILASKFEGAGRGEAQPTQVRHAAITRPLCPYPQVQTYKGQGDPNRPESFSCQLPPAKP